jgi:hypothetical protein
MRVGTDAVRCPRCGEVKERTAEHFYFAQTGRRAGAITGFCRPCHRAYLRERIPDAAERARRKAYHRAWYQAKRQASGAGLLAGAHRRPAERVSA